MEVIITRNPKQDIQTTGNLSVVNDAGIEVFKSITLELANKGNAPQVSCIPVGVYMCKKIGSTLKIPYEHILIQNVINRVGICIHIANFAAGKKIDLLGCITVGSKLIDINGDNIPDAVDSRTMFKKFMEIVPNNFKLTIK